MAEATPLLSPPSCAFPQVTTEPSSLRAANEYRLEYIFLTLLLLVNHQNIRSMTGVLLGWFLVVSGLTVAEQLIADWQLQSWFASIGLGLELHSNVRSGGLSSLFENQNLYGVYFC